MRRRWMFRGDTSRQADLYGDMSVPTRTTLKNLRDFVSKLEAWPDNARVEAGGGLVIRVTFWQSADTLTAGEKE